MKVKDFLAMIAVGAIALVGFDVYKTHRAERANAPLSAPVVRAAPQASMPEDRSWIKPRATAGGVETAPESPFKCDGRTHCSHMRSCAEATWFLQHCPNTKMDGDNDGVPCEDQWCR